MVTKFLNFLRQEKKEDSVSKSTYDRKFSVSPIFSFSNTSALAIGKELLFDFATSKPKSEKYLPFNTGRILNNSDEDIIIYVNQNRDRPLKIPANTIQPIDATIFPSISSLIVLNNSTTSEISINEINFIASKDNVTTDLLAKRVHKLLFDRGY